MSLLKKWKIILASLSFALLTACAGSSGGGDDSDYSSSDDESSESVSRAAPKKKVDEDQLKKSEKEANSLTEENHKLRKEIFDAKNKLGIPVDRPSDDSEDAAK